MRLTKEREDKLRECASGKCGKYHNWKDSTILELLAEIDALRAALKTRNETQVTGYCVLCEALGTGDGGKIKIMNS